jgi:hypothetical protein
VPTDVLVVAQQHRASRTFSYFSKNIWQEIAAVSLVGDLQPIPGSYKICMQFRNLLVLVAYWPQQLSQYVLDCGIHIPMWPDVRFYLSYFSGLPLRGGADSIEVLDRFNRSLAVVLRSDEFFRKP